MSKKNNKENADIEAVEEVASSINTETETATAVPECETTEDAENSEEGPTVVTAEEAESEPETSASVEIVPTEGCPTDHKILVKSDSGVFEVHVSAVTRQDAKYRVYLQLDQFGPNAKVPKFDVDKYLARKNSTSTSSKGRKKGEKKSRSVVVVDVDAPVPDFTKETETVDTDNIENGEEV